MFRSLKSVVKQTGRLAAPFIVVFTAVTLMDLLLQREVRTQIEEYFDNPFLSSLFCFGRALKWGLLLTAPAFFLGRRARMLYLFLWPYLVLVETTEAVARHSYGMVLDGDWLMLVYTSSAQEMREFFQAFSDSIHRMNEQDRTAHLGGEHAAQVKLTLSAGRAAQILGAGGVHPHVM